MLEIQFNQRSIADIEILYRKNRRGFRNSQLDCVPGVICKTPLPGLSIIIFQKFGVLALVAGWTILPLIY
jgi:hypothetical protein